MLNTITTYANILQHSGPILIIFILNENIFIVIVKIICMALPMRTQRFDSYIYGRHFQIKLKFENHTSLIICLYFIIIMLNLR